MNTPNDPQTAIDYNLYPASARPSGLEVPQPEQQTELSQLRTALHDIFELASRQKSNRDCATDEGLIATALSAVRVIRNVCDERKEWKSPEEVAAIVAERNQLAIEKSAAQGELAVACEDRDAAVEELNTANLCIKGLEGNLAALESELTANTQALKVAKDLLRYVTYLRLPPGDTVFDHLDFERQATINNLLK